jgi:hypothetical protein
MPDRAGVWNNLPVTLAAAAPHDSWYLVACAAGAVLLLLLLIAWVRLHPALAMAVAALALGVASGMPLKQVPLSFTAGVGNLMGHIAVVLGFGAILGRLLAGSGGAASVSGLVQMANRSPVCASRTRARSGAGGNGGHHLKRLAIEDLYLVGRPIADVAEPAARVECDGVRVAQACDLAGNRAGLHIHHLHHTPVGDIEVAGDGVHGQVVPIARAANDPCVLDEERAAGQFGSLRSLLRHESGDQERGDGERPGDEKVPHQVEERGLSLHRGGLL